MFDQSLSLAQEGTKYSALFRLPWYRSLPMSCVQSINILGDAGPVTGFQLVRDETDEALIPGSEQWWSPFDDTTIVFAHNPGSLTALELSLRIPYHGAPPAFEQMNLRFLFEGFGQ